VRTIAAAQPGNPANQVAVIGGGWAGCAAAAILAGHGMQVTMYEAAPSLGGRARRVLRDGLPLDNGQHLLLGAYEATRRILWATHSHATDPGLLRQKLAITPLTRSSMDAVTLEAARMRPPFDLLVGILRARGLARRERLATVRWFARLQRQRFRRPAGETVAQMTLSLPPRVVEQLWTPLCLAALNTPPRDASSQIFANVLKRAFAGQRGDSDFLLPTVDLSELLPDAVARILDARGCNVHTKTPVHVRHVDGAGVHLRSKERRWRKPSAIVAVGPHQLQSLFDDTALQDQGIAGLLDSTSTWRYEPICTVYLGFRERLVLPARMMRLDDAPGQWLFDRRDILTRAPGATAGLKLRSMVAVVISASDDQAGVDGPRLVATVQAQLRNLRAEWPSCVWSQVITERRATYACLPGLERPAWGRVTRGLYLAGDYTDPEFPATLEAAVRSGEAAAHALLVDRTSARSR
jgi:hydroxysqualene dehydroxylase